MESYITYMKDTSLSKKAVRMLGDNGYSFKQEGDIYTFTHSSNAAIGVIVMAAFVALFNVLFIIINPIPGTIAFILLIAATITVVKKLVGKTLIEIDIKRKLLAISTRAYTCNWSSVNTVNEIILKSKYVDEYTSAFKNTSEEHMVTISLNLNAHGAIQLFKFSADYAEPSDEVNEVYAFFENAFKTDQRKLAV